MSNCCLHSQRALNSTLCLDRLHRGKKDPWAVLLDQSLVIFVTAHVCCTVCKTIYTLFITLQNCLTSIQTIKLLIKLLNAIWNFYSYRTWHKN